MHELRKREKGYNEISIEGFVQKKAPLENDDNTKRKLTETLRKEHTYL